MISLSTLNSTLNSNVVELKFHRRRPKNNLSPWRRMLCTLDYDLLNSEQGLKILNFRPPANSPRYNLTENQLIAVWDILVQDWRLVNTETCNIISTISTQPQEKFWEYFNTTIAVMSSAQKAAFITT